MKITCDPVKRKATLKDRGLDFLDAKIILGGHVLTVEDARRDYGETRFQTVGFLADRMVMVVWMERDGAVHVISMRKCNAKEQKRYQKRFDEARPD